MKKLQERQLRNLPTTCYIHVCFFFLSRCDLFTGEEKKLHIIKVHLREESVLIPEERSTRLNMCNLQFSFFEEQIQFHCRDLFFCAVQHMQLCHFPFIERTFTSKSCTIRADFFSLFNKEKKDLRKKKTCRVFLRKKSEIDGMFFCAIKSGSKKS
jgi:hypothetical protein